MSKPNIRRFPASEPREGMGREAAYRIGYNAGLDAAEAGRWLLFGWQMHAECRKLAPFADDCDEWHAWFAGYKDAQGDYMQALDDIRELERRGSPSTS